ncbi:MAG TPA: hypothetical protein VG013_08685 [Gemmataceae bacterium]|nr:hypothetical protein [Gemmataceae bacterium]
MRSALLRWAGRWLVAGLALALGVGLVLLAVAAIGRLTRASIGRSDRYTITFGDIECSPPPGKSRADFLAEVQYQSSLPTRVRLLEDGVAARLAGAFARHPWVQSVAQVELMPPGQVHVHLVYRTPVLRLRIPGPAGGYEVQVDAGGTRLGFPTQDLPVFEAADGKEWDEPAVRAAARTAGFLRRYQERLQLKSLEGTADRLVLLGKWPGRVVWGRAPGAERTGEAGAPQKLKRLLRYRERTNGAPLIDAVYDLRALEQPLEPRPGRAAAKTGT